jgi:hypothetical protein
MAPSRGLPAVLDSSCPGQRPAEVPMTILLIDDSATVREMLRSPRCQ